MHIKQEKADKSSPLWIHLEVFVYWNLRFFCRTFLNDSSLELHYSFCTENGKSIFKMIAKQISIQVSRIFFFFVNCITLLYTNSKWEENFTYSNFGCKYQTISIHKKWFQDFNFHINWKLFKTFGKLFIKLWNFSNLWEK
jgi:hypothetical protein